VSSAQFAVSYTTTPSTDTTTETPDVSEPAVSDEVTEPEATPAPEITSTPDDPETEKKGCGASIAALLLFSVILTGAAVFKKRKSLL